MTHIKTLDTTNNDATPSYVLELHQEVVNGNGAETISERQRMRTTREIREACVNDIKREQLFAACGLGDVPKVQVTPEDVTAPDPEVDVSLLKQVIEQGLESLNDEEYAKVFRKMANVRYLCMNVFDPGAKRAKSWSAPMRERMSDRV